MKKLISIMLVQFCIISNITFVKLCYAKKITILILNLETENIEKNDVTEILNSEIKKEIKVNSEIKIESLEKFYRKAAKRRIADFNIKNKTHIAVVCNDLKVDYLIEGLATKTSSCFMLSLRLVDAKTCDILDSISTDEEILNKEEFSVESFVKKNIKYLCSALVKAINRNIESDL